MKSFCRLLLIVCSLPIGYASATDKLELQRAAENVYAIVGELDNRTPENLGNNATFGFVVTAEGVVLIDVGATYQGAQRIHTVIKQVTDKPIKVVINTGGQDHRWLGNEYFKKLGAKIIAQKFAVEDQKARERDQFMMLNNLAGAKALEGTNAVYADETFDKETKFILGGIAFELHHTAHAHTQGDSFVWLPKERIVFSGDIIYVERMAVILDVSKSSTWLQAFEAIAALDPKTIVPGHGHVTSLAQATADTYDYVKYLREGVATFMKQGGNAADIGKVDQARYSYLKNYELARGRNALQVYTELEWE
ncbi:MAG: MBL fold metallo-hydrolase [Pseudomonadota bacterium]